MYESKSRGDLKTVNRGFGELNTVLIWVLAIKIFALDYLTPLRYAVWPLYFLPLLLTMAAPRSNPITLATIFTILIVLDFFLSAPEIFQSVVIFNRSLGVLALWVMAATLVRHMKAEEATKEASQYARSLLEASLDPLVTISAEGKITDVNIATEQVTGASRDALIGSDFADYFTEPEKAREGYRQVFSQGSVTDYPLAIRHASGKVTDVLYNASVYRDSTGKVVGVFAAARDITAHKQAEAIVRDSVRRFTTALANSQLSVWEQDLQLRYTWFYNPKLGYALKELIGKTDADIMEPAYAKEIEALKRRVIETKQSVRQEVAAAAPNSRVEFFDLSIEPLLDVSGHVIGITCAAAEVTERRQAEKLTQAASQYARSLLEASLDPLVTISAEGKITDVNIATEQVTGASRDALIGSDFADYFTEPEKAREGYRQVFSQGSVTDYPLAIRHASGKVTDVLYNASVYRDSTGKVVGVFAAARDITERKLLDQELRVKNVELEESKTVAEAANVAKSSFLSSMSHELRTPLNAILGFSQLMDSGTPVPTPGQQRSLDQIQKAGWYLLELVDEILDLALIESGKATLSQEPVSLAEVIVECKDMLESQAQMRDISMTYPRFVIPCFIHADRTRTKQILINLLSNAIKYNKPSGAVVVECTPLSSQDGIRISVRDTGSGMAPGQLAQLFQPFNRLGREAGKEQGTGIGLLVTKKLVELMGGTIGVESVHGVGSTFWVDLSRASVPQQLIPVSANPVLIQPPLLPADTQQLTVLYVEDNPSNLKLVEQLIARRPGLRLLSATDGNMGILLARSHLPVAILMDINLPGISGLDAMSILRADPATMHIPIVAVSANAVPSDIERSLKAGFFAYVTKPIKVSAFMDTLDAALESSMGASVKKT